MSFQVVVFCSNHRAPVPGLGELMPYALLPVGGREALFHLLDRLGAFGLRRVLLIADRFADQIGAAVGTGNRWGVRAKVVAQPSFAGLGESLVKIAPHLDAEFLLFPRLALPGADLPGMIREHAEKRASLTWLADLRPPSGPQAYPEHRHAALCMRKSLLEHHLPQGSRSCDELVAGFRDRACEYEHFRTASYPSAAATPVLDDLETLWRANRAALDGGLPFLRLPPAADEDGVRQGRDCSIARSARIQGPAVLGDGCVVAAGACVGPHVALAPGCEVGSGACVADAVVLGGERVPPGVELRGGLLGQGLVVRRNGSVEPAPRA
ncbi:MAG: NDP-sugar synthase [Desulfovibrionaceae bacterium]|jgi:NDP-sugar pyrophosphorylase family protein|nr:NDP-sugar synthase [Desulfovibrionaceae bacterium]